jgi:hypothetical protein
MVVVGVEINNEFASVVLGVCLTGFLTWNAYMFRQSGKQLDQQKEITENLAIVATTLTEQEKRVTRLEAWQDGVRYGQTHADEDPPIPPPHIVKADTLHEEETKE